MKLRAITSFIFGFLVVVIRLSSASAQEVGDEREFDYIRGSEKGPSHWGELKKEWAACKNGAMQSPIDLSNHSVKFVLKSGELRRTYRPCRASIKNRGHDISVQWWGFKAGKIKLSGTDFYLKQVHWHSPSEHTIEGRRYGLELHMVHVSDKYKVAVIGVLYKMGSPDPFLSKLISNVTKMKDRKEERYMGVIDPREIRVKGRKYYRYIGSLTVPPCTEGVIWTINKKIETVSKDQVKALREAVHDYAEKNARPLQPLHHRQIYLFGPNPTRHA